MTEWQAKGYNLSETRMLAHGAQGGAMYRYIKRMSDMLFALLLGLVFLPFGIIIALLIKCSSKGPVFFRQPRVGKGCKVFRIYKFRTMRLETEKDGRPLSDMERMGRLGAVLRKLSLDEVPQVLNILRGDMSFIGPRPLLVEYIPRYSAFQMRRHEVLPGITGWAQVNGRNLVGWEERFQLDVWYVDHMSFKTDLTIFFKTIGALFARSGVNRSGAETMPFFMGEEKPHE